MHAVAALTDACPATVTQQLTDRPVHPTEAAYVRPISYLWTFAEKGGKTLLVMHELYSSKEAPDGAIAGMEGGMPETFAQLDELLVTLGASVGRS